MIAKRWEWRWVVVCTAVLLGGGLMLAGCEDDDYAREVEADQETDAEMTSTADYQPQTAERTAAANANPVRANAGGANAEQQQEAEPAEQRETARGDHTLVMPITTGGAIVLERNGPSTARVGARYNYTVRVTNESEHAVHGVTLKQMSVAAMDIDRVSVNGRVIDGIPGADYQVAAASPAARPAEGQDSNQTSSDATEQNQQTQQTQGQQVDQGQGQQDDPSQEPAQNRRWNLGVLAPGESRQVEISGIVQQNESFVACLTVDYQPTLCTPIEVVNPELELQRAFVIDEQPVQQAYSCDEIVAVYRLTNVGSGTTQGGTIRDPLPQGLQTAEGAGEVEISFEPLEAGETVTKQVRMQAAQRLTYEGRAMATTGPLETYSNRDQLRIMHPSLEVTVDGPSQSYLGRVQEYEVVVRNTSDDPAVNTQLQIQLPEEVERFVASTSKEVEGGETGEHVFEIGRLDPGQSRRLTFSLEAAEPGAIEVAAVARAYCVQDIRKAAQTQVQGIPAVRMEVIDRNDPIRTDETTTYEITVKNQGSAEDLNVQVQAQLPENMAFVSGQGDTEVSSEGRNITFGPISRIEPGEVYAWIVETRAEQTGSARFQLQVKSDATRRPVSETEPTRVY